MAGSQRGNVRRYPVVGLRGLVGMGPADLAGWNAAVLERAQRNNERFPVPLPDEREVRRTAYSISTWIASGGGRRSMTR